VSWSDLVKAGHSWIHAVQIEGIPHVFVEKLLPRVDSTSTPGLPTGYDSAVECLNIVEGEQVSVNIERQSGGASGDAFDLVLGWDGLADNALTGALFSQPASTLMIDADLAVTTGSKLVVDTTGWTASHGYIGVERVALTVVDGTHVNLTARGLSGSMAGKYLVKSPTYKMITDKPAVWRGRQVTLWRHLVSPERRILDGTWCNAGASTKYCRILWRGYVDAVPRPSKRGMALRCLPLVRRASLPLGHEVTAETYAMGPADSFDPETVSGFPVYAAPGSVLFDWKWTSSGTVTGTCAVPTTHADGVFTLGMVAEMCATNTGPAAVSDPIWQTIDATAIDDVYLMSFAAKWDSNAVFAGLPYIEIRLQTTDTYCDTDESFVQVPAGAPYFLVPGMYKWRINWFSGGGGYNINDEFASVQIPVRCPNINPYYLPGYWIPVTQTEGSEWNDLALPSSGFALLGDSDTSAGLIEWDAAIQGPFDDLESPDLALVRVKAVHEQSGPGLWFHGVEFAYVTGKVGVVKDVLLTLLESSGAGNRGSHDTLAIGQGAGIDDSEINAHQMKWAGLNDYEISLYSIGEASVIDLVGGHLAMRDLCLVQRTTNPDLTEAGAGMFGDCLITIVSSAVGIADSAAVTISLAESIIEAVEAPEPAEAPNIVTVEVQTALIGNEHTITVQDLPRIQAEGPRTHTYAAPGMLEGEAAQLAASIIRRGNGESILTLQVAPWVEVQPGDMINLTIAHPVTYDFVTGTRAPASIGARCLGWSADLFSGQQTVTLLLAGVAIAPGPLCPSLGISSVDSGTEVTCDNLFTMQLFDASTTVLIYEPGEEQNSTPESVQITLSAIAAPTDANPFLLTFGSSLPGWVSARSIITFPLVANCSTRQATFTHNDATSKLV